jgi:hypothetical protein
MASEDEQDGRTIESNKNGDGEQCAQVFSH